MVFYSRRRRRGKRLLLAAVIFGLAAIGFGVAAWWYMQWPRGSEAQSDNPAVLQTEAPAFTSIQGRYLLNGTIFWGRAIERHAQRPDGTYDYARPFSGLSSFGRDQYDAWVADLECPVLDIVIPYQTQVDSLVFNCRPEYLQEAAKYFDVLDLANNHSGDQGYEGFVKTRQAVVNSGIQAYGHYDPTVSEDICEVIALPVRLRRPNGDSATSAKLPVAFCAWHYFGRPPQPGEIEQLTKYSQLMPVFAFVHMGAEYLTQANQNQTDIAHRVIDAGADFVVANNPHWVQNSEVYRGKLIFYSTGNFIFDQIDSEGMRSASVDVAMDMRYDDNSAGWLQLGETCRRLHDDCFEQAQRQGLARPDFRFTFGLVAGDSSTNHHLTKRGDDALQKAIEARANWPDVLQQLAQ